MVDNNRFQITQEEPEPDPEAEEETDSSSTTESSEASENTTEETRSESVAEPTTNSTQEDESSVRKRITLRSEPEIVAGIRKAQDQSLTNLSQNQMINTLLAERLEEKGLVPSSEEVEAVRRELVKDS